MHSVMIVATSSDTNSIFVPKRVGFLVEGEKGGFGHIFPVLCKSDSCLDKIYAPAFLGWTLTSLP